MTTPSDVPDAPDAPGWAAFFRMRQALNDERLRRLELALLIEETAAAGSPATGYLAQEIEQAKAGHDDFVVTCTRRYVVWCLNGT